MLGCLKRARMQHRNSVAMANRSPQKLAPLGGGSASAAGGGQRRSRHEISHVAAGVYEEVRDQAAHERWLEFLEGPPRDKTTWRILMRARTPSKACHCGECARPMVKPYCKLLPSICLPHSYGEMVPLRYPMVKPYPLCGRRWQDMARVYTRTCLARLRLPLLESRV